MPNHRENQNKGSIYCVAGGKITPEGLSSSLKSISKITERVGLLIKKGVCVQ